MQKLDDVLIADNATAPSLGKSFCRNYLPVVVDIIMSIAGDLLSLATDTTVVILQRVPLRMRMQVNFCVFMFHSDDIIVTKLCDSKISVKKA